MTLETGIRYTDTGPLTSASGRRFDVLNLNASMRAADWIINANSPDILNRINPHRAEFHNNTSPQLETFDESVARIREEVGNVFTLFDVAGQSHTLDVRDIRLQNLEAKKQDVYSGLLNQVSVLMKDDFYSATRLVRSIRESGVVERFNLRPANNSTRPDDANQSCSELFEAAVGKAFATRIVDEIQNNNVASVEFIRKDSARLGLIVPEYQHVADQAIGKRIIETNLRKHPSLSAVYNQCSQDTALLNEAGITGVTIELNETLQAIIDKRLVQEISLLAGQATKTAEVRATEALTFYETISHDGARVFGDEKYALPAEARTIVENEIVEGVRRLAGQATKTAEVRATEALTFYETISHDGARVFGDEKYALPAEARTIVENEIVEGVRRLAGQATKTREIALREAEEFLSSMRAAWDNSVDASHNPFNNATVDSLLPPPPTSQPQTA